MDGATDWFPRVRAPGPVKKAGTISPVWHCHVMMKKIVTLLIVSQVALAGALYASDQVWSETAPDDPLKVVHNQEKWRLALNGPTAKQTPCNAYAWPRIPARCLNAAESGLPYAAETVRYVSAN